MKKFKGLLILTVFLIIFMTSSFAWLNISIKGEKINVLKAGDLSLILDETSSEGINIEGAVPVSDEKGLSQEGYTFKLVNNGTVAANYIITLDDLEIGTSEERMSDDILKYSLTKNGVKGSNVFLPSIKVNNKRVVDRGVIDAKTTNTYTLKLWMDYDTTNEGMNKIFAAKLNVDIEQENIKVEKSDKTIDINNKTETLGLEEDISNYIVESSDEEVAVIDSLGNIVGKHHGTVVFKVRNKKTGAKKEISVTITKTLKATFVKQLGVENISKEEATCLLKEKEEKSCSITLPEITPEQGYTKVGWSTEKGSHTGTTSMIDISKDSNLYTIVKKDEIVYTATFNKQVTGVSQIESTTVSCTIPSVYNEEKQEESCKIKLPAVEMKEGYSFVGWNTKKDATTGYKEQEEIELDSNKEFYPIVKKDAITLSAKFYKNGADFLDGVQDEVITKTCILEEKYNGEVQDTECSITTPEIKAGSATPNVVGYSENKDAITSDIGSKTSLTLSSNKEYYAITKSDIKTYSARFYKNGAASLDEVQDEFVTRKCNIPSTYNGKVQKSSCSITSPEIKASSKTPIVLGYSESMDNHTVILNSNTETNISSDVNYYAQTKKDKVIYTATFKVGKNVTSVEKESNTCEISEVYNGNIQEPSCSVEGGKITPKVGYTSVGYSKTNGDLIGNTTLELSSNQTFYANAVANSYTVEYYNGSIKLGTSGIKVDEELTLPTIKSLNGEKEGYTFKGWTKIGESEIVEYTDGESVSNLSTTEGEIVKLYAIYVDDIKPVCSFSNTKEIYVNEIDAVELNCIDTGSKLKSTNLGISNFEVSNDSGSIVSVSNPVEIENGYKYTVSIKGLKAGATETTNGSFTISLKENSILDNTENGNIKTTSEEEKVKGLTYSQNYTKEEGVESITATKTSCTTILDNLTCDVTLPGITAKEGYSKDGWYRNEEKIENENTTYTLTKENDGQTIIAKAIANNYVVYFDPNGGSVSQDSKIVTYGETYGSLPTPTREGYKFLGWSRNLASEISKENYYLYNYNDVTSIEIRTDKNIEEINGSYFRVNGYQQNEYIDTSWLIYSKFFNIKPNTEYLLSFYIRSSNSLEITYVAKRVGQSDGKTQLQWNGSSVTNIENNINFDNDGKWHLLKTKIISPSDVNLGKIFIGNDIPNLYGVGSYIDIADIQFTEGYMHTPYYIKNNTQVNISNDQTLFAKWQKNKYTVTYDSNTGTNLSKTSDSVYYDDNIDLTPTATKEGYTFIGWNTDKNAKEGLKTLKIGSSNQTLYAIFVKTTYEFDYTGSEQVFTVPVSGTYKLETWGAQGGGYGKYTGGKGAFSKGNIKLSKNNKVYINVAGQGITGYRDENELYTAGGYNGGGPNISYIYGFGATGGGATHIATRSGLLKTLSSYIDSIYIISAGGGAGGQEGSGGQEELGHGYCYGGDAGGIVGNIGSNNPNRGEEYTENPSNGASQTSGYAFGEGEKGTSWSGGGGAGLYGAMHGCGAGGGSSYIGNPLLTDKAMYCYNCEESSEESTKTISTTCASSTPTEKCAKEGNGYAKITLISID